MATFPDIKPTYGSQKRSAPFKRVVRFADGYEHRVSFGLPDNQNPKVFNFTFNVSESQADTIEAFLDARGSTESFDYQPEGESSSMKFICDTWTKRISYLNRATIQTTFRQVFEP
jgi:phage-related protein|tara:strand:+ start:3655 stop:3999 length:345 start_codon:yes stop_codon:yes gene_type:complete